MKFKYIGANPSTDFGGYHFPNGEIVEVDDEKILNRRKRHTRQGEVVYDIKVISKLIGNSQFELVKEVKKAAPKKKATVKKEVTDGDEIGNLD